MSACQAKKFSASRLTSPESYGSVYRMENLPKHAWISPSGEIFTTEGYAKHYDKASEIVPELFPDANCKDPEIFLEVRGWVRIGLSYDDNSGYCYVRKFPKINEWQLDIVRRWCEQYGLSLEKTLMEF